MKKTPWPLVAVLAFSLTLRCLFLASREIWYDDAFSILLARQSLSAIVAGTAADTMPPLYYFLLHFWMQLGSSVAWVRLLNVVLSTACVAVLYRLVADLAGERAGLWAALLAGISPFQIYHAQEVRMYALLALGLLGYSWFFVRAWRSGGERLWDWVGMLACATAAMYTHNLAVFSLVAPGLFLLLRRERRLLWRWLASMALVGLLAVPWLVLVPGQVNKIQEAFWTPRPGLVEVMQAIVQFTATLPLPGIWVFVAFVASLQLLVLVVLESLRKPMRTAEMGLMALLALLPPMLLFAASYGMRPVFVPRGFILSSLVYYGLAAVIISKTWSRGVGIFLAASFVIVALVSLPFQYTLREFPRSPHREAVEMLESSAEPGAEILHDNKLSYFPSVVYGPGLSQSFLADDPGSHNDTLALTTQDALGLHARQDLPAAVQDGSPVFFVVYTRAIEEYRAQGLSGHPRVEWLEDHFRLADHRVFGDLEVYRFERP